MQKVLGQKMNEDLGLDFGLSMSGTSVRSRFRQSAEHTIFIDRVIGAPEDYRDEMMILDSAAPEDDVKLYINCMGGRLDTGLMLINAIRACKAPVTAYVHEAASMATCLALACDNWVLGEFSYFMLHTATWGAFGKDQEVWSQVDFMKNYIDQFLKSMYSGFLTPQEILSLSKGQDMWIAREGLQERLGKYAEHREKVMVKQERELKRQYNAAIRELKAAKASVAPE